MTLFLTFVAIAQAITLSSGAQSPDSARALRNHARRDSALVREDSIRRARDAVADARRRARVIPVTPSLEASAFRDGAARTLLERARIARLSQDSALRAYDATTYERLSVGLKVGSIGRERLAFRTERSARVQWVRGTGALVDITGARSAAPIASGGTVTVDNDVNVPLPYVPGRDALWAGSQLAKANVGDAALLNPLANGAEAYYTYASGDSLTFQLPGRRVVVRELKIRPRASSWNTVVGSLWFDVSTGQLVRAVYRLAAPMDVAKVAKEDSDEDIQREIPWLLKPVVLPMVAQLTVVTVDYGLFEGRFWLPRLQTADGFARFGVMTAPLTLQQRFDYATVNGDLKLPVLPSPSDTVMTVERLKAQRAARAAACKDSSASWTSTQSRFEKTVTVLVRTPCDTAVLMHSSSLPSSIYASTDTIFADGDRTALIDRTLTLANQGGAVAQPPRVEAGLREMRYNRVEGANLGAHVTRELGNGYDSDMRVGVATASGHVTGSVALARSNGRQRTGLAAYHRLAADNDWDDPLTLRASLSALFFGRDQGQYYYASGVEQTITQSQGWFNEWRLFGERESRARVRSTFSLARAIRGKDEVAVRDNITVQPATEFGLALRRRGSLGEDPAGFRVTSDLRLEGATGTFDYVRAMLDLSATHPIGLLDAALTGSGGTSGGTLPVQRLWYLGGAQTLAGQPAGSQGGNAYWFTRAEIGTRTSVLRPILFGDLGWAGDRSQFGQAIRPAGSVGGGVSILDGLLRLDVARGIRPTRGLRGYLYLDARF